MATIAAGFGRAQVARMVRGSRRYRREAYLERDVFIPSSTADLWKGARPRPHR